MNRMALAAAGIVLVGGFSVAVPVVAGGSASAAFTECVSPGLMNSDHNHVVKDKGYINTQQAKIKKLNKEKPKTAAGRAAKRRQLAAAKAKLAKDQSKLRHDQMVYGQDQADGLCTNIGGQTDPASPSGSATGSASPTTSTGGLLPPNPVCSALPLPILC